MESLCCLLMYPNLSPTYCPQIFIFGGFFRQQKGLTLPLNTPLLALILMQNWRIQYLGVLILSTYSPPGLADAC